MPHPKKGESQSAYVSRCMGNAEMRKKYPDSSQRAAVCYSLFRNKGDKKSRHGKK